MKGEEPETRRFPCNTTKQSSCSQSHYAIAFQIPDKRIFGPAYTQKCTFNLLLHTKVIDTACVGLLRLYYIGNCTGR
jgi:hypothetical protein